MNLHRTAFPVAACLGAALAILTAADAQAAPVPAKITLHYDVKMYGMSLAEGIETLEHDGKTYRITSEAKGKGVVAALYPGAIRREARGTIVPQGLRTLEFQDQRGDREPMRALFDWDRKTILQSRDGKSEIIKMPEDASDRLSFFYQYAFAPLPLRELHVTAVDGRGTTRYNFLPGVREKLVTPLGELDTVKIVKQRDGPDDKGTEVWFAPALHYLPVRILVIEKNGDRADQIISRIEQ